VDPDPKVDRRPELPREVGVQLPQPLPQLGRGTHGAQRVVFVQDRDAEDGHHGVADELLDAASVALDDVADGLEEASEHPADAVRLPYADVSKPGVQFLQERVLEIDPDARTVRTDGGSHEADVLVVALGADYDVAATPGLAEVDEFYSVAGAELLAAKLPSLG